jgi:hypothetical protein
MKVVIFQLALISNLSKINFPVQSDMGCLVPGLSFKRVWEILIYLKQNMDFRFVAMC